MRIAEQNVFNFAVGAWTHEKDKIKSTTKMLTYMVYIGAVEIIWMTEVDTIMKLLCVEGSLTRLPSRIRRTMYNKLMSLLFLGKSQRAVWTF